MTPDNENKKAWCEMGAQAETRFAGPVFKSGCAVMMNPAKLESKYTHDMLILMPSDLKTIRTRFNTADRYGIPARTAFTINCKDIERYSEKYPHIVIVLDIDYGDFKTLRYASLRELRRAIALGKAKKHTYQKREDDTQGNAKDSYVMDALWFQEL
jgi:hypothetical protein